MHFPVQEPNRESTTLRLPAFALIRWAAPPLVGKLALNVFRKNTTAHYAQCGIQLTILQLLFGAITE